MRIISLVFAVLIFVSLVARAQTPVEIDVTSLTISKVYLQRPYASLSATGLPAPFESAVAGWGNGTIAPLEYCNPCLLGDSLATTFNQNTAFWSFSLGGEKSLRLYLTGTSPDVVLAPRIRLKNKNFSLDVPAEAVGKVSIYDGSTLLAYDDEVNLSGTLTTEFLQYRLPGVNYDRRGFGFRKLTFSYTAQPLQ
jgi:hypothetical protein